MRIISISILFLALVGGNIQAQKKELSNELIWASGTFYAESVDEVRSMNDGEHFTVLEADGNIPVVNKYAFKDYKKVGEIVSSKDIRIDGESLMIEEYEFNADETKMLIATDIEPIYRRSYLAYFFIYDIKTKKTTPLGDHKAGKQALAEFSPDGKKVAFTRDNNIFIYDLASGKETQVTTDGKRNEIINGSTDWVYEEEFSIVKGFYWSPNSTKIAYYRFDEREVKEFTMTFYGELYPTLYTFKYPKAGEDNSKISLFVYDVAASKSNAIDLGPETDIYIPRIKWTNSDDQLCVLRMNRLQNNLEYCLVNTKNSSLSLQAIYTETSKTYVEITDDLIFLKGKEAFIRTSEKDGYNHIYLIDFKGNSTQITKGNWDVVEFKGLDEKTGFIYYISAESAPYQKDLFAIKLDGSGKKKLSTKPGTNDAFFSTGMKYYINYHSDANTPYFITLHNASGKEIKVLKDNKEIIGRMGQYNLSKKEFFKFTTSENVNLDGWMIKPVNFDPNKKYPVYMFVYGGPGNNEVTDSWDGPNYFWHQLLAQKGYLVVCVDPRGTMFKGEAFKKSTYLQLGKLETQDCIETAKWLGQQSYVDKNRIGIQGWSFGGYMTLLCMTKGADYFKMGISVAPVTNWRFYDNIYTERFMRRPQENANGYDDNSPINHAKKLKGKLLLVHGSGDDNVHYQNTMEMINSFVKANRQFDLFIYPNRNHGIYGGTTRLHLFTMMTNYVEKNL
ncbi:MAG: S9 family peptidase [Flavobacteriales bacterium]|nr:S9 family peptidase [Flavobacteriales bacterium]